MESWMIIMLVVLFAAFVRVVAGFGDSLVGMPILLYFFPLDQADTIVATYGLLLGLVLCKQYYSQLYQHRYELLRLLSFSVIGILIGAYALVSINQDYLIFVLGILLLCYPLVYFFSNKVVALTNWRKPSMIAGLIGGFLGGTVNTNGPPFVIYGQMRRWNPVLFVAMFQPLFLLGNIINLASYASFGIFSVKQFVTTIAVFPIATLSYLVANKVRNKIESYFSYLVVGLIFSSGLMLVLSHH